MNRSTPHDIGNFSTEIVNNSAKDSALLIQEDNTYSELLKENKEHLRPLCQRLHAGFLLYPDKKCYVVYQEVFRNLGLYIGGTRQTPYASGWKDFAHFLGLNPAEINYIANGNGDWCPVEMVLRVFIQDADATFEKILEAIDLMERHDVLEIFLQGIQKLKDIMFSQSKLNFDQQDFPDDVYVHKPDFNSSNLPRVLQRNILVEKKDCSMTSLDKLIALDGPSVLLTYSEDGYAAAMRMYEASKRFPWHVNVICFENIAENVLFNLDGMIKHYLEKVDFVVPLLTKDYLAVIRSLNTNCPDQHDNIDCDNAKMIFGLLKSEYIANNCMNKKVRAVIPYDSDVNLRDICSETMFTPSFSEKKFEKLIKIIFKNRL